MHNELLLRIGEHYQQVFNGLSILASFASNDDPYQGPKDITSPERMASSSAITVFFVSLEKEGRAFVLVLWYAIKYIYRKEEEFLCISGRVFRTLKGSLVG